MKKFDELLTRNSFTIESQENEEILDYKRTNYSSIRNNTLSVRQSY